MTSSRLAFGRFEMRFRLRGSIATAPYVAGSLRALRILTVTDTGTRNTFGIEEPADSRKR